MKIFGLLVENWGVHVLQPAAHRHHAKTALVLCVVAAFGYGFGAVLQAVGVRRAKAKKGAGLIALLGQPAFLGGLLADFGSWAISRFALQSLPLFAVQTILAGSLAVTVVLARIMLGAQLSTLHKSAVVAAVAGLVLVGFSAHEQQVHSRGHLVTVCILMGVPVLLVVSLCAMKLRKSVLLAVLAGVAFTGSALAARTVNIRKASVTAIISQPLLWAVVLYAAIALVLHALALTHSEVSAVTAAMWSTEVIAAAIIGFVALGDSVEPDLRLPATAGIAITLLATVVLARGPGQDMEGAHHVAKALDPPLAAARPLLPIGIAIPRRKLIRGRRAAPAERR